MEYVNCDFCGSAESQIVANQTDLLHRTTKEVFTVVRCKSCGLHYTNPRPTPDEIGQYYSVGYSFHASPPMWRKVLDKMLDVWANSSLAYLASVMPPVAKRISARIKPKIADPVLKYYRQGGKGAFLDIGCGSGAHAHYWGSESALLTCRKWTDVAGIEVAENARTHLLKNGVRCWASLDAVPEKEKFGLIRMNWSLEHVHSPSKYFAFVANHLMDDGEVVVSVPNYEGFIYKLVPNCLELPVHLYHFTPKDIVAFGERYGLYPVNIVTFSYPEMFHAAAKVGMFPSVFASNSSISLAKNMLRFLQYFDQAGWGNDMLVVLRKSTKSQEA